MNFAPYQVIIGDFSYDIYRPILFYNPCWRRDKYEPTLKEYWVDVQTTGSFDDAHEEIFQDKTIGQGDAPSTIDLGLPQLDPAAASGQGEAQQPDDDTDHDLEDEGDDTASRGSRAQIPSKIDAQKEHALEASFSITTPEYTFF